MASVYDVLPADRSDAALPRRTVPRRAVFRSAMSLAARLRRGWDRHTIRTRLIVIVVAIEIVAAVLAGGVTIFKARTSTRVEIGASFQAAELLVKESLQLVSDELPPARILESLPLHLRFLRHVRLTVLDADGVPVARPLADEPRRGDSDYALAPAWFRALVAPEIRREAIPVVAHARPIGTVVLASEPNDEISEAWASTVALASVVLALNVAVLVALYLLFGRALAPLDGLVRGLIDLEHRDYAVRLPTPPGREFAAITDRFNALAGALEAARADNVALSRRLITAEDDERRRTAMELHDEVGPCLFGLKAAAASLAKITADAAPAVTERTQEMLAIIAHLQIINRNLLNRLRPMALGHVPLAELLERIVHERARAHADVAIAIDAGAIAASYGDAIDLTVYRCVQESLTNALRHADARTIRVRLHPALETRAGAVTTRLDLTVRDDGRGFAGGTAWGFGLRGMEERVVALGGAFSIAAGADGGTLVRATIPVPATVPDGGAA
jgi:two-component system, NarL family, sensor histidine kinase UhpB